MLAAVLAFAPVFFANLVFSYSFRDTRTADMAFASNLLGAMVGGALEYLALLTGYQALLPLVAVLYAARLAVRHPLAPSGRPRPRDEPDAGRTRDGDEAAAARPSHGPVHRGHDLMGFGPRGMRGAAVRRDADEPAATGPEGAARRRRSGASRPSSGPIAGRCWWSWPRSSSPACWALINPYLLKLLIDEAIPDAGLARSSTCFVALMIVVPIISGLIGVGQTYCNNVVGQRVMQDLRNALYAHLQRMPLRFFTETRTGEIQSRLANDVGGVQSVVTDTASSVVSNLIIAVTTIIAMVFLSLAADAAVARRAALLPVADLPRGQGPARASARRPRRRLADVTAITEETLSVSGILLSKTFGQQAASRRALPASPTPSWRRCQIRQSMVGRWFFMIVGTIFSIMPAFVYWLAGCARHPAATRTRRRSATSWPSRRSSAASSSRSASCSTCRSRSRARWRSSTASSSTST